jgi:hypothetical protein
MIMMGKLLIGVGVMSWVGGSIGFLAAATIIGQCAALIAILTGVVAVIGGIVIGELIAQRKLLSYLKQRLQ